MTLWLGAGEQTERRIILFDGQLETPSGRLSIELPEATEPQLVIDVGVALTHVVVAVDDLEFATAIWVGVDAIADPET